MEQSELNQILEQHKLWLDTNRMQGSQAYLKSANLEGTDLRGANLRGTNLAGASLKNTNLRGANLTNTLLYCANIYGADLTGANLRGANLTGACFHGAILTNAILSDVSWIIPGCLVQLNHINYGFYLEKEDDQQNFIQDSFGFIVQNNSEEGTFDMLVEDRIIRNIPDWVKYSGLKKSS